MDAVAVEDDVVRRFPSRASRVEKQMLVWPSVTSLRAKVTRSASTVGLGRSLELRPSRARSEKTTSFEPCGNVEAPDERRRPPGALVNRIGAAGLPAVVDAEALVVGAGGQAAGLAGREAVHQLLCRAVGSGARPAGRVAAARGGETVAGDRGGGRRSADRENRGAEEKRGCGHQRSSHEVGIGGPAADRSLERGKPAARAMRTWAGRSSGLELARSDGRHRPPRAARRRAGRRRAARPDPRAVPDLRGASPATAFAERSS